MGLLIYSREKKDPCPALTKHRALDFFFDKVHIHTCCLQTSIETGKGYQNGRIEISKFSNLMTLLQVTYHVNKVTSGMFEKVR